MNNVPAEILAVLLTVADDVEREKMSQQEESLDQVAKLVHAHPWLIFRLLGWRATAVHGSVIVGLFGLATYFFRVEPFTTAELIAQLALAVFIPPLFVYPLTWAIFRWKSWGA